MLVPTTTTQQSGFRKHTTTRSFGLGRVSVKFVMMGLLAALALLYLTQTTQGQARTMQFRALDEERQTLRKEQERLELEVIRLRSIPELEKAFPSVSPSDGQAAAWEKTHKVVYLTSPEPIAER